MKIYFQSVGSLKEQEKRMLFFIPLFIISFFVGLFIFVSIFGERNIISPILTMIWLIFLMALMFIFEDKKLVIKK